MNRTVPGLRLAPGASVAAPVSGVRFGIGQAGPLTLRLFRLSGTRVVVTSQLLPAQLLVLRAAAGGTPVQVVTTRPPMWEPLLAHDRAAHVITGQEVRRPAGGAGLLVDDRPVEGRGAVEVGPWQCRIDVRAQWRPTEIGSFVHTDIAVFGRLPEDPAARIASAFGLPKRATAGLARLDDRSFGIVRRGRIEYATVDLTRAEEQVIGSAGGFGPVVGY